VFENWTLVRVDRKTAGDGESFIATYASPSAKAHAYTAETAIEIEITPKRGSAAEILRFIFEAESTKSWLVFDTVTFQRVR